MRKIIICLFCLSFIFGYSQSKQAEYLEAKRQFALGNYIVAMEAFKTLTDDDVFGPYASFYYALSAYKDGKTILAEDMWKQMLVKYPDWDQKNEVQYWLAYSAFNQGKWWDAFKRSERLPEDLRQGLMDSFLGNMTVEKLKEAYILNSDNKDIATYYFNAIKAQPYEERDQLMLMDLAAKFGLSLGMEEDLPIVKKDSFAVAVVLPFMFESLATPQTVIRNSIIFDLYQGMRVAATQLDQQGLKLVLFPFDTKKKASEARSLIQSGRLKNADLIIGPLYAGPNQVVSEYSKKNKINMVNPLSSNEVIVGDNPYSFLFKPGYATQGREAARFAAQKFTDNKKAFIFYETDRDSVVASAYKESITREGFFVVQFARISKEDAQQIQRDFTEQYEVRLDTMYSRSELDSIASLPGRIVRTRSLRNQRSGRIIRDRQRKEVIETYEVRFSVQPDSIGHIFAATSSNVLANNFISLVEVRSDSIGIIGYEDWLDFSLVSYPQLERLQVDFVSPDFYDKQSDAYREIRQKFIDQTGWEPGEYHIYGYELIMQLGTLMQQYGKYFQRGLGSGQFYPGYVMEGLQYGPYHDNQVVPITTLKNLKLVNQNSKQKVAEADEYKDK